MKKLVLAMLLSLSAIEMAMAQSVELAALRSLALEFERPVAVAVYPGYWGYAARAGRLIPVVVVEQSGPRS